MKLVYCSLLYFVLSSAAFSLSSWEVSVNGKILHCTGAAHDRFWLCQGPYHGVLDRQDPHQGFLPLLLDGELPIIFGSIESIRDSSKELLAEPISFDEHTFINSGLIEIYEALKGEGLSTPQHILRKNIIDFFDKYKSYLKTTRAQQIIHFEDGVYFSTLSLHRPVELTSASPVSPTFFSNLNEIEKDLFERRMHDSYQKSFSMVQAKQLLKSIVDNQKLAHDNYEGCHSRAHIIANFIHKKGFRTQKIWLSGILTDPRNQKMEWCFHVAVIIFVKELDQELPMVLDPSLEKTKLLTVGEWLKLNNVHYFPPLLSFPIPKTVGYFFDVALSYSSHIPLEPYYDDTNVALSVSLKEAHAINKEHRAYLDTLK